MHTLVTGAAGFIGFHLTERLLAAGHEVTGVDNLNAYYDVNLKKARLQRLQQHPQFHFHAIDVADNDAITTLFSQTPFTCVVHLAAQAGVRYSITDPHAYFNANLLGFGNVLEACRRHELAHLVYASSSSVYGANTQQPFSEHHGVDHPISLYAATKRANELMAHSYSHLYELPTTGLRFFTVYGPWGRPDMALFKFTRAILSDEPMELYNQGEMLRDFTYVDDIVAAIQSIMTKPPQAQMTGYSDPAGSMAPYKIYNIGCANPVPLKDFVAQLEETLGKKANIQLQAMQPGDVPATHADISDLRKDFGYAPKVNYKEGIQRFVKWYRDYYQI